MIYDKRIIKVANELKLPPKTVEAYSVLYDFIDRFSSMTIEEVRYCYAEDKGIKVEIPYRLKDWIIQIIRKLGNTNAYFSPHLKQTNFKEFVANCYNKRINPREYLFDGVIVKGDKPKVEEYEFQGN